MVFAAAHKRAVTARGSRASVLGNNTPQVPGWARGGAPSWLEQSCSVAADGLLFLFR